MTNIPYDFQERYDILVDKDKTDPKDRERKALFYILSGNIELFQKSNHIYDFADRSIKLDCIDSDNVDFSSGIKKLILLAFNLYNGYNHADVLDIFKSLDHDNFDLAINAIKIRFGREDI